MSEVVAAVATSIELTVRLRSCEVVVRLVSEMAAELSADMIQAESPVTKVSHTWHHEHHGLITW